MGVGSTVYTEGECDVSPRSEVRYGPRSKVGNIVVVPAMLQRYFRVK